MLCLFAGRSDEGEEGVVERRERELNDLVGDAPLGNRWRRVPHAPEGDVCVGALHRIEVVASESELGATRVDCQPLVN